MTADLIRQAFEAWTSDASLLDARIRLFERVRDVPYGYPASRDPVEVLRGLRGSNSGKHYLLGELFRLLQLPVRHVICSHRFNESPIGFPDELQAMLRKNEIVDLHDYVQIKVDGAWADVDATWPHALREFGFPVNEDWDGRRSMILSVVPDEHHVVSGVDPERFREELLSRLTPRQRTLRKQFLEALSSWIGDISVDLQTDGGTL